MDKNPDKFSKVTVNTFTDSQKKELDARRERHRLGKSRSYTWDEVKQLARNLLKK